ncbi:MAG TPA: DUF1700 domain-containing protein [Terriglobales bacterium]|nr:DUF1700 domain-containing protein [Terriglobales bacterium]
MTPEDSQLIEDYLGRLRACLRELPSEDSREIVEELRSHILDKASEGGVTREGIASVVAALGSPKELARQYLTDELLVRAQKVRTPWAVVHAAFRWARLSIEGVLVLIASIIGYIFGASFFLAALIKPFNPKVGLWQLEPDSYQLALGMTDRTPQGHELLGWYLIPIGLALGGGTILSTTHLAIWMFRRFRRPPADWRLGPAR